MNADVARLLSILAESSQAQAPQQQRAQFPPPDPRQQQQQEDLNYEPPPAAVPTPKVDPKSITDWPAALKYVMNTLCKDEAVLAQVKKMRNHQRDHEKMWWASREEILKRHQSRAESNQKVQDVLRKLGTLSASSAPQLESSLPTPESEKEELRVFDMKVYLRSEDMNRHMTAEFGLMGVPFFCHSSLPDKTDEQLQALRKRIVELLEDLCDGD